MDYGAVANASESNTTLIRLDAVHNTTLKIILGAYRASPTECLYSEASG